MVRKRHLAAILPHLTAKSSCEWFPLQVKQIWPLPVDNDHCSHTSQLTSHITFSAFTNRDAYVCVCVCVLVHECRSGDRWRRTTGLLVTTDLPAPLIQLLCFEGEWQHSSQKEILLSTPHISAFKNDSLPTGFYILIIKKELTSKQTKTNNEHIQTTQPISPANGAGSTSQLAELRSTWWWPWNRPFPRHSGDCIP